MRVLAHVYSHSENLATKFLNQHRSTILREHFSTSVVIFAVCFLTLLSDIQILFCFRTRSSKFILSFQFSITSTDILQLITHNAIRSIANKSPWLILAVLRKQCRFYHALFRIRACIFGCNSFSARQDCSQCYAVPTHLLLASCAASIPIQSLRMIVCSIISVTAPRIRRCSTIMRLGVI